MNENIYRRNELLMEKVGKDIDAAISRARNIASPINAQRFDISSPAKRPVLAQIVELLILSAVNFLLSVFHAMRIGYTLF